MNQNLCLSWHGPFTFVPCADELCVFNQSLAQQPGIYLWTIAHGDGYLINYVGQASKQTMHKRLAQGVQYVLSGQDYWANLDKFEAGVREVEPKIPIQQFLGEYDQRSGEIIRLLRLYQVFLSPHAGNVCSTKQIESLLIDRLRQGDGPVASFLANERIGTLPPMDVRVAFQTPCRLYGLEDLGVSE